jgi:hypothetical protein
MLRCEPNRKQSKFERNGLWLFTSVCNTAIVASGHCSSPLTTVLKAFVAVEAPQRALLPEIASLPQSTPKPAVLAAPQRALLPHRALAPQRAFVLLSEEEFDARTLDPQMADAPQSALLPHTAFGFATR